MVLPGSPVAAFCSLALMSVGVLAIAQPAAASAPIALQFDSAEASPAPLQNPLAAAVPPEVSPEASGGTAPDAPLPIPAGAIAAPIGTGSPLAELPPPPPPVLAASPPAAAPPPTPAASDRVAVSPADGLSFALLPATEESGSMDTPAPAIATAPAPAPQLPTGLQSLFAGGANSLVAIAIGHAEGTRTATGEKTAAYRGHTDPGNGVWNLGTFSFQHGAASPEEADARQLQRLGQQASRLWQAAQARGLPLSLEEQLNAFDLANQSPAAALNRGGYLDRLAEAREMGLQGQEAILWARTRAYLDPDTRQWNAPGLGNNVERISTDQERRMRAIAQVLNTQTIPEQITATEEGAIAETLFSLDLP